MTHYLGGYKARAALPAGAEEEVSNNLKFTGTALVDESLGSNVRKVRAALPARTALVDESLGSNVRKVRAEVGV